MTEQPWDVVTINANGLDFETAVMGDGPDLALCLHGFPEHFFSWRYQMPLLAGRGYTVWAPNLRGYGNTTRPAHVRDYGLHHLIDDVAGLFDEAVRRGKTPKLLMAHDWGGIIAWLFVLHKVRPVERFIVINLPHPAVFQKRSWQNGQYLKSWYILFFQLPWLPEAFLRAHGARAIGRVFRDMAQNKERFPDAVLEVYRQNALLPGAMTAMLNYYRALVRRPDRKELMQGDLTTDVPTLMLWGDQDTALGKHLTEGTDAYVSNLTLHHLPNASHWAQQDAPDEVNALISAWLDA